MKVEEAIEILKHHYGEQFDMAIEALEKQIEKKLIYSDIKGKLICPNCGCVFIAYSSHYSYCPECGQKLKWWDEK